MFDRTKGGSDIQVQAAGADRGDEDWGNRHRQTERLEPPPERAKPNPTADQADEPDLQGEPDQEESGPLPLHESTGGGGVEGDDADSDHQLGD
jgi:hypothetical protein